MTQNDVTAAARPQGLLSVAAHPPVPLNTVVRFDDFLSSAEQHQLLALTLAQQAQFQVTATAPEASIAQPPLALSSQYFSAFYQEFKHKLLDVLPLALKTFNYSPFSISYLEMQLMASNDGCALGLHCDAEEGPTATRELTFVYYFYQKPKRFSGGELRLYETELSVDGPSARTDRYRAIAPQNNTLILFPSCCWHEVSLIHCPSRVFGDSRFTVTGWLHGPHAIRVNR